MKRIPRRILQTAALIIIIGAALLLGPFGRSGEQEAAAGTVRPVRIERPRRMDLERTVDAWGTLRSENQVTLIPKVSGTVRAVLRDVGDSVAAGEILTEIDPEPYRLDFAQAEAARAASASAWERIDRLYAGGNTTRQDWESARAAFLAAEARASAAALRLEWTRIPAPVAGVVLVRHVNTGSIVSPESSGPLFTIGSLENLELELHLSETDYPLFTAADLPAVTLRVEAFPDIPVGAELRTVAPWVDPATRSFAVVCRVRSPVGVLRPGMLVRARFTVELLSNALTVPDSALSGGGTVWSVDSAGRATRNRSDSLVLSGDRLVLPEEWDGRRIIVEGQHFLSDGDAVRIVDSGEANGS